jgi:hypothetical protein
MKHLTVPVLLAGSPIALSTMEAGAVFALMGWFTQAASPPAGLPSRRRRPW